MYYFIATGYRVGTTDREKIIHYFLSRDNAEKSKAKIIRSAMDHKEGYIENGIRYVELGDILEET